jgi:hypothetical protein
VENGAFVNTMLTSIAFEEYPQDHELYGQPLLEVGVGSAQYSSAVSADYAVFSLKSGKGNLKSITLPSHLKKLGVNAFYYLNLTGTNITFNMDAHLESVETRAFNNCKGLTELHLPSLDALGVDVFYNSSNLKTITFGPDSQVKILPDSTFSNCKALTSFQVPATVTRIGSYTFRYCSSLASITFAEGSQLKEIGTYAFGETALTEFTLPETVEILEDSVFDRCKKLKRVNLSTSLSTLQWDGYSIFYGCTSVEYVHIPEENPYFKSVDGVLYDDAETILYYYPAAKDLLASKSLIPF